MKHPKPPHHHHRHAPPGFHNFHVRMQMLRAAGIPEDDLAELRKELIGKLPSNFLTALCQADHAPDDFDISERVKHQNDNTVATLRESNTLVTGELPPHILHGLLERGVNLTQLHTPAHHGGPPHHFRDLAGMYPNAFRGVLSLDDIANEEFSAILVDAFFGYEGEIRVSPIAVTAARLWHEAKLVAVMSDHCAPHHIGRLRCEVEQYLFWE